MRPRSDNPSPATKRKRFERARRKLGLVAVRVHVHRVTLAKLARHAGIEDSDSPAQAEQLISQLVEDWTDLLTDEFV